MSGCEKAIEYYTGVKNLKKKVGSLTEESFKIARAYSSAGVALKIGEFCFASRDRLKACPPPSPHPDKSGFPPRSSRTVCELWECDTMVVRILGHSKWILGSSVDHETLFRNEFGGICDLEYLPEIAKSWSYGNGCVPWISHFPRADFAQRCESIPRSVNPPDAFKVSSSHFHNHQRQNHDFIVLPSGWFLACWTKQPGCAAKHGHDSISKTH